MGGMIQVDRVFFGAKWVRTSKNRDRWADVNSSLHPKNVHEGRQEIISKTEICPGSDTLGWTWYTESRGGHIMYQ